MFKGESIYYLGVPCGRAFRSTLFSSHALSKTANFTSPWARASPGVLLIACHASIAKLKLFTALRAKVLTHKKGFPLQSLTQQPANENVLFKPRRQGFLLALPKRNKRLGVFPLREPESRISCRIRI